MAHRLIRCNDCKHTFFTEKVDLTDTQIKTKKNELQTELRNLIKTQDSLVFQITVLQAKLHESKIIGTQIGKDIDLLNYICQCSDCGNRFNALENEVHI